MKKTHALFLILLIAVVAGCSSGGSDTPAPTGSGGDVHPTSWVSLHGADARQDTRGCQGCHGFDFNGSGNAVSCFDCHSSGPPFVGAHPASWNADPLTNHRENFKGNLSDQTAWTSCAVAACHGSNLQGGTTAPSCQNAACHPTGTNNWPPAPAGHATFDVANAATNAVHGRAAKDTAGTGLNAGNFCILCHGDPSNTFDGGFVRDPNIMNIPGTDCSATVCHPDAKAHPSDWISANNNVYHSDGTLTDGSGGTPNTQGTFCSLCHNTVAASPAGPDPLAPSCFSSNFQTQGCHSGGPGGAGHVLPYPENLHGPAAKADLVTCQGCHGTNGTGSAVGEAGSNPRFNVPKNGLPAGCESAGCHAVNTAHPTGTDRWTFNRDGATRRTHFAAGLDGSGGRDLTACSMCHDATSGVGDNAGFRTGCATNCHLSLAASGPTAGVSCTYCHQEPPDGAADLTGSTTYVTHTINGNDVSAQALHKDCNLCHGASQNGATGILQREGTDYDLTLNNTDPSYQGGDHLDGNIEMNGPHTPSVVGTGYNQGTWNCTQTCHSAAETLRALSDSGLTVEFGNYGAGDCSSCHGYPPDGTGGSTNHFQANRSRGGGASVSTNANFFSAHGFCSTCHGLAGDTNPTVSTASNFGTPITLAPSGDDYDIASMHNAGSVQMNGAGGANAPFTENAGYDSATGGCTDACHAADWVFSVRKSTPANTINLREFGAGNCTACHGYPPASGAHTKHAGGGANYSYDCQVCHPASTAATHNGSLIAPGGTIDPLEVDVTLPGYGNIPAGGTFTASNTCTATYCHGGSTPDWYGVGQAGCGSCHGDVTGRPDDASASGNFHQNISGHSLSNCNDCHTHDGSSLTEHANGPADTYGDALISNAGIKVQSYSYGSATLGTDGDGYKFTEGSCVATCHGTGYWGGRGACDVCHDSNNTFAPPAAPKVVFSGGAAASKSSAYGSHLEVTKNENLATETDWSIRCMKCHPGHSVANVNTQVTIPLPPATWASNRNGDTNLPMQTRTGIDYTTNGGIHLGGYSTHSVTLAGASFDNPNNPTEAEICWGCHGADSTINEWGYNTDPDGNTWPTTQINNVAGDTNQRSFHFGKLYTDSGHTPANETSAWVDSSGAGNWRNDGYSSLAVMDRQIVSVHSVNFTNQVSSVNTTVDPATGVVSPANQEPAADIRCSYCHDVHDMQKGTFDTAGFGPPFLRGSWLSNPYGPDTPPESGQANTASFALDKNGNDAFTSPRALSSAVNKGGYFIDANSGNPTNGLTVADTAGLCTMCHGTNVNTMNFYDSGNASTNNNIWRGSNGHGYSTLGGTLNGNSTDLFDPGFGNAYVAGPQNNIVKAVMGMQPWINTNNSQDLELKNCDSTRDYLGEGTMKRPDFRVTGWIPASGLPFRPTSIANCDYTSAGTAAGASNWYDNATNPIPPKYHNFSCSKCHSPHATGLPALLMTNCLDPTASNWQTQSVRTRRQSMNCHRKESNTTGWNRLAPAQ